MAGFPVRVKGILYCDMHFQIILKVFFLPLIKDDQTN